jgi:predicted nucleic acid-binding protein
VIFVDTGPFLALYRKRDQYHAEAARLWRELQPPFLTHNHVVDEFATGFGRLIGFREAADRVGDWYASTQLRVVPATREDEMEALQWMRKYAHQRISFTDCVSFAMMRRLRIATAFTFDRHFRDAGFQVIGLPEPRR